MAKFNVECPRCRGTGRFDRGTCFECKGRRSVVKSRKPVAPEHNLVVTFETGEKNYVKMYFFTREYAIKAVEHQMLVRGWKGIVTEVGQ